MTKKLLCVFLSLSVALSCLVSADVFSSADPVNLSSEEISKLEKYDGRSDGIITPVRDQGDSNLCWSYSSSSASEASILKSGLTDKSPNELYLNPVATAYRVFKRTSDPLENTGGDWQSADYMKATGNSLKAVKLFSMWWGPTESTSAAADPFENPSFRFENGFYIPEKDNLDEYISDIKEAVAKYGAVTFQYNNVRETEYYTPRTEKGSDSFPHACTVIGWDDTIEADRFSPSAAGRKGGWLVKNSYRSLEYFYLSYENTSSSVYAFTYAPVEKYDYNYYYDGNLDDFSLRNDKTVANVFKAKKGGENGKTEVLRAVNAAVIRDLIFISRFLLSFAGLRANLARSGGALFLLLQEVGQRGGRQVERAHQLDDFRIFQFGFLAFQLPEPGLLFADFGLDLFNLGAYLVNFTAHAEPPFSVEPPEGVKMFLPVGHADIGVFNGVATVDHHIVAHINTNV